MTETSVNACQETDVEKKAEGENEVQIPLSWGWSAKGSVSRARFTVDDYDAPAPFGPVTTSFRCAGIFRIRANGGLRS